MCEERGGNFCAFHDCGCRGFREKVDGQQVEDRPDATAQEGQAAASAATKSLQITSSSSGPSGTEALRVQLLAELGSALGWRPNLAQVRLYLQEAQQAGFDPRLLYREAAMARPLDWPPAPSYEQVMSPGNPLLNAPNVPQPKEESAELDESQDSEEEVTLSLSDEEDQMIEDFITLGKHFYAQGAREFDTWKDHLIETLGNGQILPYIIRVWPEVSGQQVPSGDLEIAPAPEPGAPGAPNTGLVISVLSLDLGASQTIADSIRKTLKAEGRNATVIPGMCELGYLQSLGATAIPVVVINNKIVWQGDAPPPEVLREWLEWPRSLEDAVQWVLDSLGDGADAESLDWTLGMAIRNSFGLWGANLDLLRACGSEKMHADAASEVILGEVRRRRAAGEPGHSRSPADTPIAPESLDDDRAGSAAEENGPREDFANDALEMTEEMYEALKESGDVLDIEETCRALTDQSHMLELVNEDGRPQPEFQAWARFLQVDHDTLVPEWWPWATAAGGQMGVWERAQWFHSSLSELHRQRAASYPIDDPRLPRSLLVLHALMELHHGLADEQSRSGQEQSQGTPRSDEALAVADRAGESQAPNEDPSRDIYLRPEIMVRLRARDDTPNRVICRRCHAEFSFTGGQTGSYCATCQREIFSAGAPDAIRGWKPILIREDQSGRWFRHFERVDHPRTACGRWNVDVDSIPDSPSVRGEIVICRRCLLAIDGGA